MLLKDRPANDDQTDIDGLSRADLVQEIAVLRAELGKCSLRIAELVRLANVDPLLDLPNRRSFLNRLERAIAHVQRTGVEGAVMFLDVDGLKAINDKLGHGAGDKALIKVAALLLASVRSGDLVARLAGDEFAILLERTDELSAWTMALRIVETVDDSSFSVNGERVALSVAVGVAMIGPGDTSEAVISRADKEMYRIKELSAR